MDHQIAETIGGIDGVMKIELRDANTGRLKKSYTVHNVTCDRGKNVQALRYGNNLTYTGVINYLAVGTGAATPASSDTQLVTELARTTISSALAPTGNQATIEYFFGSAVANGTLTEAGGFMDGTASANSGRMFDHVTLPSIVKTTAETLTITLVVTIP